MNSTWTVGSGHGPCARARARSRWFGKSSARSQNSKRLFKNSLISPKKPRKRPTFRPANGPATHRRVSRVTARRRRGQGRANESRRLRFQSLRLKFQSLRLKIRSLRLKRESLLSADKCAARCRFSAAGAKKRGFHARVWYKCAAFSYICSLREAQRPLLFQLSATATL